MTRQEFISSVKIEFIEQSNGFGHYPFQLFINKINGDNELHSLYLNCVSQYYKHFKKFQNENTCKMFMSLDFPTLLDIQSDFVVILSYENNEINLIAIPYDVETGKTFDIIESGTALERIYKDYLAATP